MDNLFRVCFTYYSLQLITLIHKIVPPFHSHPTFLFIHLCGTYSSLTLPDMNFAAIVSGGYHTCALSTGGRVMCWGWNNYGQLGIGSKTNVNRPKAVNISSGMFGLVVSVERFG
jgi:alpha-tubulin suppressor-like RCC1 family protein